MRGVNVAIFDALRDARGRITNAADIRTVHRGGFRRRCEALFGDDQPLNARMQIGFGRSHGAIDAWMRDCRIPDDAWAIVELLEACPKNRWPASWRALRSYRSRTRGGPTSQRDYYKGQPLPRGPIRSSRDPRVAIMGRADSLLRSGSSPADVAADLNINLTTIQMWRSQGLIYPSVARVRAIQHMARAREMRIAGSTWEQIDRSLGLPMGTSHQWASHDWTYRGVSADELDNADSARILHAYRHRFDASQFDHPREDR